MAMVHCRECGKKISETAHSCPHCGDKVKGRSGHKSKTTAILLAVFLGFWTWLYTYKRNAWKFWLNLILSIFTFGIWALSVGWIWPIIDNAIKPKEYFEEWD